MSTLSVKIAKKLILLLGFLIFFIGNTVFKKGEKVFANAKVAKWKFQNKMCQIEIDFYIDSCMSFRKTKLPQIAQN